MEEDNGRYELDGDIVEVDAEVVELVREMYRIMGMAVYDLVETELDMEINRGLDNNFEWN
uniref:Uncharacterized protein n=1 Tax=viral metagenome TaxID=1070528 RepID=A0A6M3KNG4_9ZZZZ